MTGYCNAVRKLEKKFEGLELHHIPRLKNQAADDLAKIGSKREAIPSDVFLEHIHTPSVVEDPFTDEALQPKSVMDPTEVEVPAVVDLIMEVLVITPLQSSAMLHCQRFWTTEMQLVEWQSGRLNSFP